MTWLFGNQTKIPPLPPKPETKSELEKYRLKIFYKGGYTQEFYLTQAPEDTTFLETLATTVRAKRSYVFWGNAFFRLSEITAVTVEKNDPKQAS